MGPVARDRRGRGCTVEPINRAAALQSLTAEFCAAAGFLGERLLRLFGGFLFLAAASSASFASRSSRNLAIFSERSRAAVSRSCLTA